MSEIATARYTVPADHPSLPGHFPGRPILPGVVLLDAVFRAAGVEPARLLRAKFTAPVGPGDEVEIGFERRPPDRLAFACRCRGVTVLSGEVAACASPPPPPR
jgi:3-hydroxyacyl-[acyl-carrier-protein] dehydratase